jgi:GNAT superfamily N-acetyltransferase
MSAQYTILAQAPWALTEPEIQDFIAMVRAGGEVGNVVLEENVRNAQCLVVARDGLCLIAVGALKNPKTSYRKNVRVKAGVTVDVQAFPFELGYLFVLPSARNHGIGHKLCEAALSAAKGEGVFATARATNDRMHAILSQFGFSKAGKPYASPRGGHQLQLFLRHAAQQAHPADPLQRASPASAGR